MKRSTQQGFTLIELMIVVVIIGILAAVALRAYQSYSVRTKLSEVVLAGASCKVGITEALQSSAGPDASAALPNACPGVVTQYVTSVVATPDGRIDITVNITNLPQLDGTTNVLSFVPVQDGTAPVKGTTDGGKNIAGWSCGARAGSTVVGATTIPANYLPSSCQGTYP